MRPTSTGTKSEAKFVFIHQIYGKEQILQYTFLYL